MLCLKKKPSAIEALLGDFDTTAFLFAPGMIALDQDGHVAAGTSTNGLTHKVPGYVDYV